MKLKNTFLSLSITSAIMGTAFMPVVAMEQTSSSSSSNSTSSSSSNSSSNSSTQQLNNLYLFKKLPREINEYIVQFIDKEKIPQDLDLTNPEHMNIIRKMFKSSNIWQLRLVCRHFYNESVRFCFQNVQSIKISNDIITDEKKFNGLIRFIRTLTNLTKIDLSETDVTDKQLAMLLANVNKNKITELDLSDCNNLQNPNLNQLTELTDLNFTFCCKIKELNLVCLNKLNKLTLIFCCLKKVMLSKQLQHLNFDKQPENIIIPFVYI